MLVKVVAIAHPVHQVVFTTTRFEQIDGLLRATGNGPSLDAVRVRVNFLKWVLVFDDLRWTGHLLFEDGDFLVCPLQKPVLCASVIVELHLGSWWFLATPDTRIDKLVVRKDVPVPL